MLIAVLALAACGEKQEPTGDQPPKLEPFTVLLDYFPNADHAGIYAAKAEGLYKQAGLDVKIETPPDAVSPLKLLQAGKADVAISYEPELLLARDAGAHNLVAVGALVQKPLTSLMALPGSGVKTPADLAGKRVGTAGLAYQSAYLQTILKKAGVNPASVKETNVNFNLVPAMLSKKVDATLGAFWNYEGVELSARQQAPDDPAHGRPRRADLRRADPGRPHRGPQRGRRFAAAALPVGDGGGHAAAARAAGGGRRGAGAVQQGARPGAGAAAVKATLPVMFPVRRRPSPWGWMDVTEWASYEIWMRQQGLLKRAAAGRLAVDGRVLGRERGEPQVLAREAGVGRVGGEERAHLGLVGAGLRAAGQELADELEIAEVAGRDHVEPAEPVELQHLDRPRADLGDREQRGCSSKSGATRGGAAQRDARAWDAGRSDSSSAGACAAIVGGGRHVAQARPARRPSAAIMRRWISIATVVSISCSVTAASSVCHGSGARRTRSHGRARTARADHRVVAEAS